MSRVAVHGHAVRDGETVFAFCVLRLRTRRDRDGVAAVVRSVAGLLEDAAAFISEWVAELEEPTRFVCAPWSPPANADLAAAP